MKHIVHVSNDFEPISGGINTHLKNLLECLSEEEFKITLLVPTASEEARNGLSNSTRGGTNSYTVVRSHYKETDFKLLKLIRLTRATQAGLEWIIENIGEIDLIHQHDRRATRLGAALFSSKYDTSMIWTNHCPTYFDKAGFIMRVLLKMLGCKPDGIIAVHRSMSQALKREEFTDIPVRYIPNGVNIDHFTLIDKPQGEKTVILFPQRLVPMKGGKILAKAAIEILSNNKNSEFSFWFAGDDYVSNTDDRYIKRVKKMLKGFRNSNDVKFLGNPSYEEMPWYYSVVDIVVLPLQVETENISVFEAWASGAPLITTKQVEVNGYMIDKENCLVVPNKDPKRLADTILRLSIDDELRDELVKQGRELVESRFTWSHTAERTSAFYHDIFERVGDEVS